MRDVLQYQQAEFLLTDLFVITTLPQLYQTKWLTTQYNFAIELLLTNQKYTRNSMHSISIFYFDTAKTDAKNNKNTKSLFPQHHLHLA